MIIAIDPDLRKSGVAIFSPLEQRLSYVGSLPLWEVFDLIEGTQNAVTVIEQSPHTNTWHKGGKGAAVNVGKNLAISILLVDFCKSKGLGYVTIPPNGYSHYYCVAIGGKNRFLEREFKRDHQWEKQTNKDSRAAVGMIYSNRHLHKSWLRTER